MQGRVLGFDAANGTGAIRGADGARYNFTADDWKGGGAPAANDEVDFEAVENRATEIFVTRAALNLNLGLDKIGQSVDTEKLRGLAVPLLGSWHPILALIALVACFWTFMSAVAPAGVNLPGLSPNLFGAPGAIKRGLTIIADASATMNQLNQYTQQNSTTARSTYGFLLSLAGILPLTLYLIPLGSVLIVLQEARRTSATVLAFFTGIASVALPVILYFGLGIVIDTLLKDINQFAQAMGSTGYSVALGTGGWTIIITGALQIAISLGLIRHAPRDLIQRRAAIS